MKETGIIMSGSHPKDILEGRKTVTRRVIKPQPISIRCDDKRRLPLAFWVNNDKWIKCPYGQVGDRLWVRETWATYASRNRWKPSLLHPDEPIFYKASEKYPHQYVWRPSIFMPRWASRILLEITEVWVERVADITASCAIAEGVKDDAPVMNFRALWDSLNAKRGYRWDTNPWVWVISFKVIKEEIDER